MILKVSRSETGGTVKIPGSKSHTIRALFIASLADGVSEIMEPLVSDDALSAVEACRAFGAHIDRKPDRYVVKGFGGIPHTPHDIINVGNSGTTLRFALMTAALGEGCTVLTGDHQVRKRPLAALIEAANDLGAEAFSTRGNGMAPVVVRGRMKGGITSIDSVTSQFLSSMLINCPLLENDTEVLVTRLNEVPYVGMTLWWLDKQNIVYINNNFKSFTIKGNQHYSPFSMTIPGDFSSATFFIVLAAISGASIEIENLDISDPQGDKEVLDIIKDMGAEVTIKSDKITVTGKKLAGREIDMNSIPDAVPAMAVAGCFADGETRLVNVPHARMKETDRISAMCNELKKMGADIEELPDGLIIRKSTLKGTELNGYYDHRIVMALCIAGMNADGTTYIDTAEAINVTFPEFTKLIKKCGGMLELY